MQTYYRFCDGYNADSPPVLQKLFVVKETPKGAWVAHSWTTAEYLEACQKEEPITSEFLRDWGAKIIYHAAGRKYAYPTIELAMDSYKRRKVRQIQHGQNSIDRANNALEWIRAGTFNPETLKFDEPEPISPWSKEPSLI